jgi:prevent-host-death family protein
MATWQLQEAKARFSELVETARTAGPQVIARRGVETAVLVPAEEWNRSAAQKSPPEKTRPALAIRFQFRLRRLRRRVIIAAS